MHFIVGGLRHGPRVIALALMAAGIAGCGADTTRFNDSPFPSWQPEATGPVSAARAPVDYIEPQPLPPQGSYGGNQNGYGGNYNGPNNGGYGGNYNNGYNGNQNGSYNSPQTGNHYQTQSAAPVSYAPPNASPPYSSGPSPEYTGSVDGPPRPVAPLSGPRVLAPPPPSPPATVNPAPVAGATSHVIAQGDTLYNISRRYGRSVNEIAKANNMEQTTPLRIGARITIPGSQTAQATMVPPKAAPKLEHTKPLGSPTKLASVQPMSGGVSAVPSPAAVATKPAVSAKRQDAEASAGANAGGGTGANTGAKANVMTPAPDGPTLSGSSKPVGDATPSFRWPVRGRVIEGFGPKGNGQQNDGINLAVPEGTPVKAAEDGVVAYAGNELKGYGNLVLVRHSNGYVTAYAHSKELLVKRGEEVKRGQVIAKSGQTGNVDAPQLHFEVRKGQAPLNPIPMLKADNGSTVTP
jgi:murein DD-endopeptidase MepM/ murein hydrolase activator NlpD